MPGGGAKSAPNGLSIDDKATQLLISATEAAIANDQITDEIKMSFYGQFANAMQEKLVRNMRTVLGLPEVGPGSLAVLSGEDDE